MILLALLVILGVGFSSANLRSEVDQLQAFYPMDEVREIYNWWITHDAEVGEIFAFMQTEEANAAWNVLYTQPELQGASAWTAERDVQMREFMDSIMTMFGWFPMTGNVRNSGSRSWATMMEEIRAITDSEGAAMLAFTFINTPGSEFAELYFMTQAARPAFTRTMEDPVFARWAAQMRAFGVDVDGTLERMRMFFQWD